MLTSKLGGHGKPTWGNQIHFEFLPSKHRKGSLHGLHLRGSYFRGTDVSTPMLEPRKAFMNEFIQQKMTQNFTVSD